MVTGTGRPRIPAEYGVPSRKADLLPWSFVEERMSRSKHYWLATTGPDGRPHVRPIDGVWLDEKLYFGGSAQSNWRRNLVRDPRASINLEDGQQAVILQGHVSEVCPNRDLAVRLAGASNGKYGYGQKPGDYEGAVVLEFAPEIVLAWRAQFKGATRWRLR
jgi:hypothetical protein